MSNASDNGIHLTKSYYKDFLPTDLQWTIDKIDDDFTLYDLFRLVYHAQLMIPGIFHTMGMSEFLAFWDQIQLDRDPDDVDDVKYLELYWHATFDTRVTPKTGKSTDQRCIASLDDNNNYWDNPKIGELPNLMSFHGVGPGCPSKGLDFHECGDDCPKTTGYAIEFTPLNNLSYLPIRVSPKVNFYPPFTESEDDFKRTGFELTIEPTLWCFITSIFWELTFAGSTPDAVSDHSQEISDSLDEAKKHMKNMEKEKEEEDNTDAS